MAKLLSLCVLLAATVETSFAQSTSRPPGPVVAYAFEASGSHVLDVSNAGAPINLTLSEAAGIRRGDSSIHLTGRGGIVSREPARKLTRAMKRSRELTIEVWLRPGDLKQSGPARILTLSSDTSNRSFTLGQDGDRFDVRLRTTTTNANGLPSLSSPPRSVSKAEVHVVFTRDRNGKTRLSVNGSPVANGQAKGTFANWSDKDRLAIGDEVSGGRPWKGSIKRIAIYSRAFTDREVRESFKAGPDANPVSMPTPESLADAHFERRIAPILAKRCLECHDLSSAKGGLVLDRKEPAMADAVTPGDPQSSSLWLSVENDEMPHNRAPLSAEEKLFLKNWIKDGAAWSLDWIDPADYVHEVGSSEGYVRRLTVDEYIRSVQVAVDLDIRDEAKQRLPAELRADGFSNTAYNLTVDLDHIEAYHELAKLIVDRLDVRAFAKRFWGKQRLTDKDMRGLIQKMGAWILRGPLDESEVDLFRGISTTVAASGGDYEQAVKATIQAMLQAPRFVYRIEQQASEDATNDANDYELASRISYIVWGSPPDRKLMDAASEGRLTDPDEVRKQVGRMLKDERAVARSRDFIAQWLNLGHVDSLRPSPKRFPNWNSDLAGDMRQETLAFFEHVVWKEKRPLSDLLDAQVTFCSPALAKHYGLSGSADSGNRYDLSAVDERGGLLTQGSVLTIGGDDASTVTRGLFVLKQLLRGVVNDPPPCVDTTPVPSSPGSSARMIAEARIKNESCGGCHARFEPLAFGLSKFDGLGAFDHSDEHGNRLRDDGEVLVPGTVEPKSFGNSSELMKMLAQSDRVRESLVWKLTQYAIGRPPTAEDAPVVREIHRRSQETGATYQTILTEIVASRLVTPE